MEKNTCYCYKCNQDSDETCSGTAKAERTAAVHPNIYNQYKGWKVSIEGVGVRFVEDKYSAKLSENRIDVYVGNTGPCKCDNNSINGWRKVTFHKP